MKIITYAYQKTDATTFSADEIIFATFATDSLFSVYTFECSFDTCLKWWTHVLSMVMNRSNNSALLLRNTAKHSYKTFPPCCISSIVNKHGTHLAHTPSSCPSCPNFKSICDIQHFLKCLPCLLTQAFSVDDFPIQYYEFSSPFLVWSSHLVDHYDVDLDKSHGLV